MNVALIFEGSLWFLMLTPVSRMRTETYKHEMISSKTAFQPSTLHTSHKKVGPSGISCIPITYALTLCKFHYLNMLGISPVFKWIDLAECMNSYADPIQSPSKAWVFTHNKDRNNNTTAFKCRSFLSLLVLAHF